MKKRSSITPTRSRPRAVPVRHAPTSQSTSCSSSSPIGRPRSRRRTRPLGRTAAASTVLSTNAVTVGQAPARSLNRAIRVPQSFGPISADTVGVGLQRVDRRFKAPAGPPHLGSAAARSDPALRQGLVVGAYEPHVPALAAHRGRGNASLARSTVPSVEALSTTNTSPARPLRSSAVYRSEAPQQAARARSS
jgi:hypothetical protein